MHVLLTSSPSLHLVHISLSRYRCPVFYVSIFLVYIYPPYSQRAPLFPTLFSFFLLSPYLFSTRLLARHGSYPSSALLYTIVIHVARPPVGPTTSFFQRPEWTGKRILECSTTTRTMRRRRQRQQQTSSRNENQNVRVRFKDDGVSERTSAPLNANSRKTVYRE